MVSKTLRMQNKVGIHARPASLLIDTAKNFQCEKRLEKEDKSSDLKSIITLLKLQCRYGEEITLRCEGVDEQDCLNALVELIESRFGEE